MKQTQFFTLLIIFSALFFACKKDKIVEKSKILTLQPGPEDGQDAVFSLIVPENNYGTLQRMSLYAWTQNGGINVNRAVVSFDFSTIPANAVIDSAFLNLYFYPNHPSPYDKHEGNSNFYIERITSDWLESTVKWSNQPSSTTENRVFVSKPKTNTQDFLNINIKQLVENIVVNKNYGFMLKLDNETPYNQIHITTSDYSIPSKRPSIRIHYHNAE